MFVVAGVTPYQSHERSVGLACPDCSHSPLELVRAGSRLSLFFLPVARLSTRRELQCTRCGYAARVADAEAAAFPPPHPGPLRGPVAPQPVPSAPATPQDAPAWPPQDR